MSNPGMTLANTALLVCDLQNDFIHPDGAYAAAFSRLLPGIPVRIVNLRTAAIGRRPPFDLKALAPSADSTREAALRGSRKVWFDGGWH